MSVQISRLLKNISNKLRRKAENLNAIKELNELSGTNGFIIGFISKNDKPVFQKDIENEFGITRSTASKVLTLMEKKGLIERVKVESDARLRQIVLTNKAKALHHNVVSEFEELENMLLDGFSEADKNKLKELLCRVYKNIDGGNYKC